ncbi:hypothetical protein VTJ83DRAFT_2644 [Remersonia thermophila]|uniref:MFS transporter n=1 Tax=Remersonia thermophila TaxID=72144 RepID=A0ABR4DJD3_9PEZI
MSIGRRLLRRLPFSSSTTPLQALAYLLCICLFSISFLVFLNSSVSFVITDLIGIKDGVGDIVGTLGFADELVALVACPFWGLISDRVGVRHVAVAGYAIIGLALLLFVQARNVYPELLLARVFFALGASAATTMVTAILPSLAGEADAAAAGPPGMPVSHEPHSSVRLSVDSQVTITPERFYATGDAEETWDEAPRRTDDAGKTSALAGWVGLFTGCGALIALSLFLPLPAQLSRIEGLALADAIRYSFYVVGAVAFLVGIAVFFGLRGLRGEDGKGFRVLLGLRGPAQQDMDPSSSSSLPTSRRTVLPYRHLLKRAVLLGLTDSDIALGYLGGFVARGSTVAISLFMPLFVNAYFFGHGFCHGSPTDPSPELKKECRQAYVLASILTGVAQLVGLFCAPAFGYLSGRRSDGVIRWPVAVSAALGVVGYLAFPRLPSPELRNVEGRGGGPGVLVLAALIGASQIGAIVCSLGSLSRGVLKADVAGDDNDDGYDDDDGRYNHHGGLHGDGWGHADGDGGGDGDGDGVNAESPLFGGARSRGRTQQGAPSSSRVALKGSVAGVYSWCGGAAILLLTKLGGYLFDAWSRGAPFYLMAAFNAALLVASVGMDLGRAAKARRQASGGAGCRI